jgi:hypothetical protein
MRRLVLSATFIFSWTVGGVAGAQILVAPEIIKTSPKQAVSLPAQRASIVELGSFDEGEAVGVQVEVNNAVYKDLSAYIVDAPNMALARQNLPFRYLQGETKKIAPFRVMAKIGALGPYYLVLDNRFAGVIEKKVAYQIAMVKRLTPQQSDAIRAPLMKGYAALKQQYQFRDFQIHVRSCGQANAFSTTATGDVILCTEMYEEMVNRPGAMAAVLLHELGHTLLNLWGSPHYADEDVADQFATIMLLRSGEQGRRAIAEWMEWFAGQDSRAQARVMLVNGDTHSLSTQRIRNIQENLKQSADLIRRWNNVLYPNMTDAALRTAANSPGVFDDADVAKRELTRRGVR